MTKVMTLFPNGKVIGVDLELGGGNYPVRGSVVVVGRKYLKGVGCVFQGERQVDEAVATELVLIKSFERTAGRRRNLKPVVAWIVGVERVV